MALFGITDSLERVFRGRMGIIHRPECIYLFVINPPMLLRTQTILSCTPDNGIGNHGLSQGNAPIVGRNLFMGQHMKTPVMKAPCKT